MMQTHTPTVRATVDGYFNANVVAHVKASAYSTVIDSNVVNWNQSGTYSFLDTDQLLNNLGNNGDFDIIDGYLTGNFHLPNLDSTAYIGSSSTPNVLHADVSDTPLTFSCDITNVVAAIFGIPAWNGSYSVLGYGGDFQFLDLYASLGLGVSQSFDFTPAPTITFQTSTGQVVTVTAGQDAHIHVPLVGALTVTPTINPHNTFSNNTSLLLQPSLNFDVLHVSGSGDGLPSFDWDVTGGPLSLSTNLLIPLTHPIFELGQVQPTVADSYYVDPGYHVLQIKSLAFNSAVVTSGSLPLNGTASGFSPSTVVLINGKALPTTIDAKGNFQASIPVDMLAHTPILHVSLSDSMSQQLSSPQELVILPAIKLDGHIRGVTMTQTNASGQHTDMPVAGDGMVKIQATTDTFKSGGSTNTIDIPAGSTFFWDGMAIPTMVTPHVSTSGSGASTIYSASYDLAGTVPASMLTSGGKHTLSFTTTGINAPEVTVGSLTINNPVPWVTAYHILPATDRAPLTLLVDGYGFTSASTLLWGKAARPTQVMSAHTLMAMLNASDITAVGDHLISVRNPGPGGGMGTGLTYSVPKPVVGITEVNGLTRLKNSSLMHSVNFTNTGNMALTNIMIQSVQINVGHNVYQPLSGLPATVPYISPSHSSGLMFQYSAGSGMTGQAATVHVTAVVNGKTYSFTQNVKLP
jgi:hypothetical protein